MATNSDDFERADGLDLGPNWNPQVPGGTDMGINAGRAAPALASSDGIEQYNATYGNDQYSQFVLATFTGSAHTDFEAAIRMAAPGTGGADVDMFSGAALRNDAYYGSKTTIIFVVVDGGGTVLASEAATTWAATDTLKITVTGTAISLYRNGSGTPLLTASNGTYASGAVGIKAYTEGTVTDDTIASWDGGDLPPVGGGSASHTMRYRVA